MGTTDLSGLVAAPHVLGDVLDALDGLSDLRRHHGEGHHSVDALHLPEIRSPRGVLLMAAGAGTPLSSAVLYGGQLAVPELQTVERASRDLLEITFEG